MPSQRGHPPPPPRAPSQDAAVLPSSTTPYHQHLHPSTPSIPQASIKQRVGRYCKTPEPTHKSVREINPPRNPLSYPRPITSQTKPLNLDTRSSSKQVFIPFLHHTSAPAHQHTSTPSHHRLIFFMLRDTAYSTRPDSLDRLLDWASSNLSPTTSSYRPPSPLPTLYGRCCLSVWWYRAG